jgi:D-glycero-D-manno-heptose 1,7-bisphosphate phosphatase
VSILDRDLVASTIQKWRNKGLVVGYTSGVFDLLHAGHLDYLNESKIHCDKLVVGVNVDQSVKQNKGEKRPIVTESYRANLVAGLKPVDAVFLFSELNNNENIKVLKPNVYIKAGDYKPEQLSSAPLIKEIGGKVVIIPVKNDISSSSIISSIESKYLCSSLEAKNKPERSVVFLDRDGVINVDKHYLNDPSKFELEDTVLEGIKLLAKLNCAVVVVTNQAGIGMGYFDHEAFFKVNQAMLRALGETGIVFDKIYYCPHSMSEDCDCRKPKPGMLNRAFKECSVTVKNSYMIGDQSSDIEAGKAAGVGTIQITNKDESKADHKVSKFLDAIKIVASVIDEK